MENTEKFNQILREIDIALRKKGSANEAEKKFPKTKNTARNRKKTPSPQKLAFFLGGKKGCKFSG